MKHKEAFWLKKAWHSCYTPWNLSIFPISEIQHTVEHGSYDNGLYDNTDSATFYPRSGQNPIFSMYFTTVITTFYHGSYDNTDDPTYFWWSQGHFYHGSYDISSPQNENHQKQFQCNTNGNFLLIFTPRQKAEGYCYEHVRPSVPPSLRHSVDISVFGQCRVHFSSKYPHFWFVGL